MRFSILALLVVTAIVAVFCVALSHPTIVWAVVTGIISYCVVVWAVVKAWSSSGRKKGAWLGCTVAIVFYEFMKFGLPYRLPQYLYALLLFMIGSPDFDPLNVDGEEALVNIVHDAIRIGLGAVGGCIGFIAGKPAKTE